MNVLVIGGGGREHTLCWKLNQSEECHNLFAAPGNAGTANCATNLPLAITDFEGIKKATIQHKVDLVIVCLLYTSPSPRDATLSRMPSSA